MIGPAFQSTPPGNSGGDLVGDRPAHLVGVVSIHAPETQGVMQSRHDPNGVHTEVSIHAPG